jgi:hypothetical protein
VVANRVVAGRIIKVHAAPEGFAVDVVLALEHH